MGVSYTAKIYTKDRLFFIKLLFRWSGSVWQLLWADFFVYLILYILVAIVYQNITYENASWRESFEMIVKWLGLIRTSVPLSFMLGFFVTSVLSRWWSVCMSIPWLHGPSFYSQAIVDTSKMDKCDLARKIRITILRYLNLSWILGMAGISAQIQERFGYWSLEKKKYKLTWQLRLDMINKDSKVQKYFGSLVTQTEMEAFGRSAQLSNETDESYTPEYWLPLVWASRLLRRARNIGCIADERQHLFMVENIAEFRSAIGTVWMYSEFNIPLVYTQVAVAAVYLFLLSTLMSTQLTDAYLTNPAAAASGNVTLGPPTAVQFLGYFPIIGALEFVFYLGWFKIGVCLLNSMGQDKADIPMSDILNQNLKASVKLGGAENTIFPDGLTDNGEPEEQQIAEFLQSFDFNGVHAHDKFLSAEETAQQLRKQLARRIQRAYRGTGSKDSSGINTPKPKASNLVPPKEKTSTKSKKNVLLRSIGAPPMVRLPSLESIASSFENKSHSRKLGRNNSNPEMHFESDSSVVSHQPSATQSAAPSLTGSLEDVEIDRSGSDAFKVTVEMYDEQTDTRL